MDNYEKRGYLNSEFKLFHLTDTPKEEFRFHYHDFDKIIIFIKGKVNYMIEGKTYRLQPYDVVLVNRNDIHRPDIDMKEAYERIIVYISPGFMDAYRTSEYDLSYCLKRSKTEHSNVLRVHSRNKSALLRTANELLHSFKEEGFANALYRQVLFLEFMIQLNRAAISDCLEYPDTISCNQTVVNMIQYINANLTKELSIEHLSSVFYLSRYYMMRIFKEETGYTIGRYITYKRLSLARELINSNVPITQVCYECGFKDYSTFSRAYKNLYGHSPRQTHP